MIRRGDELVLKLGPKDLEYPLTHWDGNAFTFTPSSENASDGSISLATFKAGGEGTFPRPHHRVSERSGNGHLPAQVIAALQTARNQFPGGGGTSSRSGERGL